jgi:hypothetical protein
MGAIELWLKQVEAWHDFYVVVGGAAAGLTGLMFVVVRYGEWSQSGVHDIDHTTPGAALRERDAIESTCLFADQSSEGALLSLSPRANKVGQRGGR